MMLLDLIAVTLVIAIPFIALNVTAYLLTRSILVWVITMILTDLFFLFVLAYLLCSLSGRT